MADFLKNEKGARNAKEIFLVISKIQSRKVDERSISGLKTLCRASTKYKTKDRKCIDVPRGRI